MRKNPRNSLLSSAKNVLALAETLVLAEDNPFKDPPKAEVEAEENPFASTVAEENPFKTLPATAADAPEVSPTPSVPPKEEEFEAAYELKQFIQNDSNLYKVRKVPITRNMIKKKKQDIYDSQQAEKAFRYLAEDAARKFTLDRKETTHWSKLFPQAIIKQVSKELTKEFEDEWKDDPASLERL